MFSSLLRAPLVALVAHTVAVSTAPTVSTVPSLTVRTSTSNVNVDGLQNPVKATATVANTANETIKLLNDPHGVLNPFPGNAFTITGPSGSRLPFSGVLVNYNSTFAAGLDHPSPLIFLAPGHSIDATHDLSAAYDFIQSDAGVYSVEPSNLFTHVDANGTPQDLCATVDGIAKIKLSRDLAFYWPGKGKGREKNATFHGCSESQQTEINLAAAAAEKAIAETYSYIKKLKRSTNRYTTWYGTYDAFRKGIVEKHWKNMSTNRRTRLSIHTYNCGGKPERDTTIAWVDPTTTAIWVYPRFWEQDADGKAFTLVHEATHFRVNGYAVDYKYGEADCKQAAKDDPELIIHNADSFEFFARNRQGLE